MAMVEEDHAFHVRHEESVLNQRGTFINLQLAPAARVSHVTKFATLIGGQVQFWTKIYHNDCTEWCRIRAFFIGRGCLSSHVASNPRRAL